MSSCPLRAAKIVDLLLENDVVGFTISNQPRTGLVDFLSPTSYNNSCKLCGKKIPKSVSRQYCSKKCFEEDPNAKRS